jgi:hemin uptake protein HemP
MNTPDFPAAVDSTPAPLTQPVEPPRLTSQQLFQHGRALEILHEGRVYELRLTRLNKLILTA